MSQICLGKKFLFGVVSMACITVMACYLKLDGETIVKLVGMIVGMYMTAQAITDSVKKKGGS
jgi:hypothetical protein